MEKTPIFTKFPVKIKATPTALRALEDDEIDVNQVDVEGGYFTIIGSNYSPSFNNTRYYINDTSSAMSSWTLGTHHDDALEIFAPPTASNVKNKEQ